MVWTFKLFSLVSANTASEVLIIARKYQEEEVEEMESSLITKLFPQNTTTLFAQSVTC